MSSEELGGGSDLTATLHQLQRAQARERILEAEPLPYWLDLRCDGARCTKVVCAPVRLLAAKRGGRLLLRDVLARLRCSQCGEPPELAAITDSPIGVAPHDFMQGAKWRVALVP